MISSSERAPISFSYRLRAETREQHQAAESTPFRQAIVEGTLPRARYFDQLKALHAVHRRLEGLVARSVHPVVKMVWHQDLAKSCLLRDDISALQSCSNVEDLNVARVVRSFCARMEKVAKEDPICLLGYVYALEGTNLGSSVMRKRVVSIFDIEPQLGAKYYNAYGERPRKRWEDFRARLDRAVVTADAQRRVIVTAREGFRYVTAILNTLSPAMSELTTIN